MKKKFLIVLLSMSFHCQLNSQNLKIDALKKAIQNCKNDTSKISRILDLYGEYNVIGQDSLALLHLNQALNLSLKKNIPKALASCYSSFGGYYYVKGNYQKALNYYDKAIEIGLTIKNENYIAIFYTNKATVLAMQSNYNEALNYYFKSLKIYDKASVDMKKKEGLITTLQNIGGIYQYQKNYNKAIEYFNKGISLNMVEKDSALLTQAYCNLGMVFRDLKEVEKAWYYNKKALEIDSIKGDLWGIGANYGNLAALCNDKKNYRDAIFYAEKSLKIKEQINDLDGIATILNNLGETYNELKQFALAKTYFDRAIKVNKELNSTEIEINIVENLANSEFSLGRYKEAYLLHKKFKRLTDSIFNIENTKQLSDVKTQYEVDKKEIELTAASKLEKEKIVFEAGEKSKRQILIIIFVVFALVIVGIMGLWMRKRYKLTAQQKRVIEEKNKKITDSLNYAQKIQNSILPNAEQIKQYLPESFIFLNPKDVVSGDFFYLNYIDNKSFIAVVDCTGHGVPGAFMSMIGHTLLNEIIVAKNIHQPDRILNELHASVYKELQQERNNEQVQDGMDIALCVFNHNTKELQFSGARNSLFLFMDKNLKEFKGDQQSIGGKSLRGDLEPIRTFKMQSIFITHEAKLFMTTDGFIEQIGETSNQKFGTKNYNQLLQSIASKNLSTCVNEVETTFNSWKQNEIQFDDVLMLGCKLG